MAGEGGAPHPPSRRKEAVFRGPTTRIRRHPVGLSAVHVGSRSDGETQDRRADAAVQLEFSLWGRSSGPVLLGACARLRLHLHAYDHDEARAVAARRMAPAANRWRL